MKNTALLLITAMSFSAFGKNTEVDVRYSKGLLKKITCSFSGFVRTPTGSALTDINFDENNTVCDPLTNTNADNPEKGLLAKLIVPSENMSSPINSVMEYFNNGLRLTKDIYFADVNVPTRNFTQGFTTQSGDTLVDANGNKLVENFALEYDSVLKLSPSDSEGDYEIASLADDGARLFVKENGVWSELINNDGIHSTRFGCPFRTIHLTKDSEVPVKLLYFQGPRYQIANVLLWKKHRKARVWKNPSRHSLCGIQGNNIFYKGDTGKPTAVLNALLRTGWSVLPAANFKMPEQKQNPCVEEALAISDFAVQSVSAPTAVLTWSTNVPASSQLIISSFFTGEVITTALDTAMLTDHEVKVDGLIRGYYYTIKAASVDAKGNSVSSNEIMIAP